MCDARTRRRKRDAEHYFADAPEIIEPDVFEAVQQLLKMRNPRRTGQDETASCYVK